MSALDWIGKKAVLNHHKEFPYHLLACQLMDEHKLGHAPHEEFITFVKGRPGHDRRDAIDAEKMTRELDWNPSETSETGIRKTVQAYLV